MRWSAGQLPSYQTAYKKAKSVQTIGTTHQFDVELITSLKPDVVLGNEQLNSKDISTIEGIGSQLLLTSANSVKDIQRQMTLFGELLGKQQQAKALNDQIEERKKSRSSSLRKKKVKKLSLCTGHPAHIWRRFLNP
ncbi:hypothetical protein BsIDN1_68190 [Bacillus safensis]|uniref:Fe/B12 periplasmic-binding domain-containing protein n=1 Tax=Bacillus safensis TaxID=561879 RepID=A0A5S9MJS3_BACIA|nr:hypothetical protein BsIDN1_68190 [Bacillus safensis]